MKITLGITCLCGKNVTVEAKRTLREDDGKVYEDYSDICAGFEGNTTFKVHQSHPDATDITCLSCGRTHEFF